MDEISKNAARLQAVVEALVQRRRKELEAMDYTELLGEDNLNALREEAIDERVDNYRCELEEGDDGDLFGYRLDELVSDHIDALLEAYEEDLSGMDEPDLLVTFAEKRSGDREDEEEQPDK